MPELPEVETIRRDLHAALVGKKIKKFEAPKLKVSPQDKKLLTRLLPGNKIMAVERRGKLLIFKLSLQDKFLLVHLKMTGQLIYQSGNKFIAGGHNINRGEFAHPLNKHTQAIFTFVDGIRLFFNDLRRFGYVKIVDKKELENIFKKYGPEPLSKEFSLSYLIDLFHRSGRNVKATLLDQGKIAGIGNIYADEACFCAKIKPWAKAKSLKLEQIKSLHQCLKKILKLAIKYRGTTFSDYKDATGKKGNFVQYLKVYGRAGEKCLRCEQGIIKKIKVAGRGTAYCPGCQKG